MTAVKTDKSDREILAELEASVAAGELHPTNLTGFEGAGSFADRCANFGYGLLSRIANALPARLGYAAFGSMARLLGLCAARQREQINIRLRYVFPDVPPERLAQIRRQFWWRYGASLYEALAFDRFMQGFEDRLTLHGLEHIAAAKTAGKPIAFVHAHQANWELAFPLIHQVAGPYCGLYAALSVPQLQRRVLYRRARHGARPYPRTYKSAPRAILQDMAAGRHMAIALDQRAPGQVVKFFGQWAETTLVPIKLAQRAGAHLIPIDIHRSGPRGQFDVRFHANLLADDPSADDVIETYNALLEGWIRERPADWFWVHNRWLLRGRGRKDAARREAAAKA